LFVLGAEANEKSVPMQQHELCVFAIQYFLNYSKAHYLTIVDAFQ
jgi:hypothetical protein